MSALTIESLLWQIRCKLSTPEPPHAEVVAAIDDVLEKRQPVICDACRNLGNNIKLLLSAAGDRARCRGCGQEIFWLTHRNGKKAPYDPDGANHFSSCKRADDFRQPSGKAG